MEIKIISEGKEVKPEAPKEMISGGLVGDVSGDLELKAIGQVMGLERDSEIGQNQSKLRTLLFQSNIKKGLRFMHQTLLHILIKIRNT